MQVDEYYNLRTVQVTDFTLTVSRTIIAFIDRLLLFKNHSLCPTEKLLYKPRHISSQWKAKKYQSIIICLCHEKK